jgi:hypothetical protein
MSSEDTSAFLKTIDTSHVVGLRDRALIPEVAGSTDIDRRAALAEMRERRSPEDTVSSRVAHIVASLGDNRGDGSGDDRLRNR